MSDDRRRVARGKSNRTYCRRFFACDSLRDDCGGGEWGRRLAVVLLDEVSRVVFLVGHNGD